MGPDDPLKVDAELKTRASASVRDEVLEELAVEDPEDDEDELFDR